MLLTVSSVRWSLNCLSNKVIKSVMRIMKDKMKSWGMRGLMDTVSDLVRGCLSEARCVEWDARWWGAGRIVSSEAQGGNKWVVETELRGWVGRGGRVMGELGRGQATQGLVGHRKVFGWLKALGSPAEEFWIGWVIWEPPISLSKNFKNKTKQNTFSELF